MQFHHRIDVVADLQMSYCVVTVYTTQNCPFVTEGTFLPVSRSERSKLAPNPDLMLLV